MHSLEVEYLAAKEAYEAARERLRRARAAFYLSAPARQERWQAKRSETQARDRELYDRYCAGEAIAALAAEYGLAPASARARISSVGVALGKPEPGSRRARPPATSAAQARDRELYNRYGAGEAIAALAAEYGLTRDSIRSRISGVGRALGKPARGSRRARPPATK
jgi:ABC-type Na+ transport system ATPase subunit NatA